MEVAGGKFYFTCCNIEKRGKVRSCTGRNLENSIKIMEL